MGLILEVIKVWCLFLAILFIPTNIARSFGRQQVTAMNYVLQAIGITGFIYLQWLM